MKRNRNVKLVRKEEANSFQTIIEKNEKGFFCRQPVAKIFQDEYLYKVNSDGKYVFADKRCNDSLCKGRASVKITKEFDKYAIADMEMIKYDTLPDDETIKQYIVRDNRGFFFDFANNRKHIMIRRGTKKGDYIFVSFPILKEHHFIVYRNGNFQELEDEYLDLDDGAESIVSKSVIQFVTDLNGGTTVEEYLKDFLVFHFKGKDDYFVDPTDIDDEMIEANDFGIVNFRSTEYVYYAEISIANLAEATEYFSKEELVSIIKKASEYNKAANEKMCSLMKKARVNLDAYGF